MAVSFIPHRFIDPVQALNAALRKLAVFWLSSDTPQQCSFPP